MVAHPIGIKKSNTNRVEMNASTYKRRPTAASSPKRIERKKCEDTLHLSESLLGITKRRRHRVIVELKDIDAEEEVRQLLVLNPDRSKLNYTIFQQGVPARGKQPVPSYYMEVPNPHTLLLNKHSFTPALRGKHSSRQLHFDCVGGTKDLQMRTEYSDLLDQLLFERNNCCLMRFTVVRNCDMLFLCDLLVREVDKRMQQMHGYIHSIRLEYYDMQKFSVASLFERAVKLGAPRSKSLLKPLPRNHFNNTLELLNWLQEQYTQLWTIGRGHDILELSIKFSDIKRRMYSVKMAVVYICASKLDAETKVGLRNFLENIDGAKRLRPNLMTDCLREYFNGSELWRTWMVFDVPRYYVRNLCIDDMLQLANAAYAGVRSMNNCGESNASFNLEHLISNTSFEPSNSSLVKSRICIKKKPANKSEGAKPSILFLAANDEAKSINSLKSISPSKNCESLSYWYCLMDEQIANVMNAMDNYYERKHDTEISKISCDIKEMVGTNIEECPEDAATATTTATAKKLEIASLQELQQLRNQYKMAAQKFRQLTKEIERSKFGDLLQIYLKTKKYDLTQHALRYKEQQLELCQSHVSNIINHEMSALQQQKQLTSQSVHTNSDVTGQLSNFAD